MQVDAQSVDAQSVVVDINGIRIVSAGVLHAAAGTVVGLVGPNGSGKSDTCCAPSTGRCDRLRAPSWSAVIRCGG